jgi:hypothetical protein
MYSGEAEVDASVIKNALPSSVDISNSGEGIGPEFPIKLPTE